MGVSTVTAARILKGQLHHSPGEETRLEMDKFPYVALSKVRSSPYPIGPKAPTLQLDSLQERAGLRGLLDLSSCHRPWQGGQPSWGLCGLTVK